MKRARLIWEARLLEAPWCVWRFPSVIAQTINMLYNMVDRMYIGQIEGTEPMRSRAWG